ncbi:MAG: SDR family oxidoreductase [Deltaproteobacteria bacterium]|jgi:3-oxoacyl-[acyl-carrier protein] reductase|nr:SDR family oxidoreductase [Deltaproteobacteria bacterium]MBW2534766.1 SDR family oxidoreductase [Deltaproteobacteria bacterium]
MLKDQVAIVTGSSRGIGAATAKLLAAQGARVVVNYVNAREQGEQVASEIRAGGGDAMVVQADVTVAAEVDRLVAETRKGFGPVDILVNNANISFPIKPFVKFSWEELERKLMSELKASFFSCQAVTQEMIERKRGCIVNVSSGLSRTVAPGFVAHSTAKAALDSFSRALALELGRYGIRVNVVAPGLTITDATANQPEEAKRAAACRTPLCCRLAQPDDVAGAVLFYCTEWSKFVTGTYLPVCGGTQMP